MGDPIVESIWKEHGSPTAQRLMEQIDDLEQQANRMQQNLDRVGTEDYEPIPEEVVLKTVKNLRNLLASADFLQRKRFLASFIRNIEVDGDDVTIEYTFPVPPFRAGTGKGSLFG